MTNEQRQHPRYAIELDAEVIVGGASVAGRTHDISRGGFCMMARGSVPVGASCDVKLALVFSETEFSEHLTLPAIDRLVHADEGRLSDRRQVRAARSAEPGLSRPVHQVPRRRRRRRRRRPTTTRRSEPMTQTNRRTRAPRFNVRLSAEVKVDAHSLTGTTRNLSTGGVCIEIDRPMAEGKLHPADAVRRRGRRRDRGRARARAHRDGAVDGRGRSQLRRRHQVRQPERARRRRR